MGLLDDLKKQAEDVRARQDGNVDDKSARLVNGRLEKVAGYLMQLAEQLSIVQPQCPYAFTIPGVGDLTDLKVAEVHSEHRKKKLGNDFSNLIDHVKLTFNYRNDQKFEVERIELPLIERLKDYLERHGFVYDYEERRHESGRGDKGIFTIPCVVRAILLVRGDYEKQRIVFVMKNIERLGEQEYSFDAYQVDEALLDEFAKFAIGQPNKFRGLAAPRPAFPSF